MTTCNGKEVRSSALSSVRPFGLEPKSGIALVLLASTLLPGCASVSAVQTPITVADLGGGVCPTRQQLSQAASLTGVALGSFRDIVISECVKAINRNYGQFKLQMHNEATSTRLTAGILASGAAAIGSFARADIGRRLAAGNSFVLGASAVIDKEIFFQQTLPALEASMDANRDRILTRIVDAQRTDLEAKTYSLISAGYDLDAYQSAGNLYAAVSELTRSAAAEAEQAREERILSETRVIDLGTFVPVEATARDRYQTLTRRVRGYREPADAAKVEAIGVALGLRFTPEISFEDRKGAITGEIVKRVHVSGAARQEAVLVELERLIP